MDDFCHPDGILVIDDSGIVRKFYELKSTSKFESEPEFLGFLLEQEVHRRATSLDEFFDEIINTEDKSNNVKEESEFYPNSIDRKDTCCSDVELSQDVDLDGKLDERAIDLFKMVNEKRKTKKGKHIKRNKFNCRFCKNVSSITYQKFRSHFKDVHPTCKPFLCNQCGAEFHSPYNLRHHQNSEHGALGKSETVQTKYKCDICGKMFTRPYYKTAHMRLHTGQLYNCATCGRGFTDPYRLQNHQIVHTKSRKYTCERCGKLYNNVTLFNQHKRMHEGQLITCDICGAHLGSENALKNHRVIHMKRSRDHTCTQCGNAFRTERELRHHQKCHDPNRERKFKCQLCEKSFFTSSQFNSHMRKHSDTRPHTCDVCGKGFFTPGTLREHTRIHTGERPFKCTYCTADFNQSGSLYTHVKLKHRGMKISLKKPDPDNTYSHYRTVSSSRRSNSDSGAKLKAITPVVEPVISNSQLMDEEQQPVVQAAKSQPLDNRLGFSHYSMGYWPNAFSTARDFCN